MCLLDSFFPSDVLWRRDGMWESGVWCVTLSIRVDLCHQFCSHTLSCRSKFVLFYCSLSLRSRVQPQPTEHLPADYGPHTGPSRGGEPDGRGDHWHRGTRADIPLPAVVGCPEHRGTGHICSLHPLLKVQLLCNHLAQPWSLTDILSDQENQLVSSPVVTPLWPGNKFKEWKERRV